MIIGHVNKNPPCPFGNGGFVFITIRYLERLDGAGQFECVHHYLLHEFFLDV